MNFQGRLKLFGSSMFSSSLRSLCGLSIRLCQGRELAFRYLHCKGSLFCSSGGTWLPNSHGELGMTFCRKPVTDYPENGRPKFQTHFKPRDFEPTGSPTFPREYTDHQNTVRFQRTCKAWLCNLLVKTLRGKIRDLPLLLKLILFSTTDCPQ